MTVVIESDKGVALKFVADVGIFFRDSSASSAASGPSEGLRSYLSLNK